MTKRIGRNTRHNRRAQSRVGGRDSLLLRGLNHLARAQQLTRTGSWVLRIPFGRCLWSPGFFQIFAFDIKTKKPALTGLLERVHPEDRLEVRNRIERAMRESHGGEHEYRLLLPDGLIKHIHAVLDPV